MTGLIHRGDVGLEKNYAENYEKTMEVTDGADVVITDSTTTYTMTIAISGRLHVKTANSHWTITAVCTAVLAGMVSRETRTMDLAAVPLITDVEGPEAELRECAMTTPMRQEVMGRTKGMRMGDGGRVWTSDSAPMSKESTINFDRIKLRADYPAVMSVGRASVSMEATGNGDRIICQNTVLQVNGPCMHPEPEEEAAGYATKVRKDALPTPMKRGAMNRGTRTVRFVDDQLEIADSTSMVGELAFGHDRLDMVTIYANMECIVNVADLRAEPEVETVGPVTELRGCITTLLMERGVMNGTASRTCRVSTFVDWKAGITYLVRLIKDVTVNDGRRYMETQCLGRSTDARTSMALMLADNWICLHTESEGYSTQQAARPCRGAS